MEHIKAFDDVAFNFLDFQKEYLRRRRVVEAGKKPRSRLDSGEITLNPDPTLIPQELQKHIEQFNKLKVAYLEQETKEKFLRDIITDPPVLVEQENVQQIEHENRLKKGSLKERKSQVAELQHQLDSLGREACAEYSFLKEKVDDAKRMTREMDQMEAEIEALTQQQKELELPEYDDPDMSLPVVELNSLAGEYEKQAAEIAKTLSDLVQNAIPGTTAEMEQLEKEVQSLQKEKEVAEAQAKELVRIREIELKAGQRDNEATASWYRAMIAVVQKALRVENLEITPNANGKKVTFDRPNNGASQRYSISLKATGEIVPSQSSATNVSSSEFQAALQAVSSLRPREQLPYLISIV
ncbi:hypothetical protein TRVA0_063S00298 [Trichomonascus vanleenenianus]|uniref:uncharacterized protein n=1 Tax=Trichomonascus vanleenenianus TaxID=2268995 RepID=UPI003EC9F31D